MRRSLSGLYQEMLLQCIPKLWKLRILVIKFWQCFYRLKCIFWSFVYFFTNFRSFFFLLDNTCDSSCFQDNVIWAVQSEHLLSNCDHVITYIRVSGVLKRTMFRVCSDFLCANRSCHTTLKLTWFCLFFPVWCFCQWSVSDVGFFALMKYFFWTVPKSLLFNITVAYVSPPV